MLFNGIEMTPKEMAKTTFEDLQEMKRKREEGKKQADKYILNNKLKAMSDFKRKKLKGGY